MPPTGSSVTSSKRATNACRRCRQRKVKCSGTRPCINCLQRRSECSFDNNGRRLLVSERYLRNLERSVQDGEPSRRPNGQSSAGIDDQISGPNTLLSPHHCSVSESGFQDSSPQEVAGIVEDVSASGRHEVAISEADDDLRNTLVAATASYVVDDTGRSRALGESSTWSLSRRTFALAEEMFPHRQAHMPLNEQGTAYDFSWTCQSADRLAIERLPSYEYAVHLTNIVKFHIGLYFHLWDDSLLATQLHRFYTQDDMSVTDSNRTWLVQLYLIMAFGKALTVRGRRDRSPPGSNYFTLAMSLLPDLAYLYRDVVASIEILCTISLYLQSADHRNAAYLYIGQAMRMALTYGLHRERSKGAQEGHSGRCRSVWWTVYVLDRSFTSSMGVPTSLRDQDISITFPSHQNGNRKDMVLSFYARISRNLAQVIDTVYGPDGRLHRGFLSSIQKVLETAANLGREIEKTFPLLPVSKSTGISRIAASLNIFYHHVVMLATYPLLFCLLEKKMQDMQQSSPHRRRISNRAKALLQNSIESASKTARILTVLRIEHLLEYFLPFDLEHAFSAAFVLTMAPVVLHEKNVDQDCRHELRLVMEDMVSQGNRPSEFRISELEALEKLQDFLWTADGEEAYTPIHTGANPEMSNLNYMHDHDGQANNDRTGFEGLDGLSPDHIWNIAQLLPYTHESTTSNDGWFEDWVWD